MKLPGFVFLFTFGTLLIDGRFLEDHFFKFLPKEPFFKLIPSEPLFKLLPKEPIMSFINIAADNSPLPLLREIMGRKIESQIEKYRPMFSPLMVNDPDMHRNVSELISSKGYPVEEHLVQTKDGFLLGIQRIPKGIKFNENHRQEQRPAIYLHHGLLGSGSDWVLNFPHQSLGFLLADAGYDVWIGNARGNTYSRRHTRYNPTDSEFWKFSWDEIALLDLPAAIDYIRAQTGQEQIFYVGHSMGTTIAFALLSEKPEYNDKIKAVIALAPVANVTYMTAPIRYLAPIASDLSLLLNVLGQNEFLPNDALYKLFSDMVCGVTVAKPICDNMVFLLGGIESKQLNETRLPVYLHHFPSGTSTYTVVQYAQLINSKQFQKFDYGKRANMKKYGQTSPPVYNVENIRTPIALYWSLNDLLADPTDVELLRPKIKNLIKFQKVPFPEFTHLDFVIAKEANKYLYNDIISTLELFR